MAFSVSVVEYVNKLPVTVVTAHFVNIFKNQTVELWAEVFSVTRITCFMIERSFKYHTRPRSTLKNLEP